MLSGPFSIRPAEVANRANGMRIALPEVAGSVMDAPPSRRARDSRDPPMPSARRRPWLREASAACSIDGKHRCLEQPCFGESGFRDASGRTYARASAVALASAR